MKESKHLGFFAATRDYCSSCRSLLSTFMAEYPVVRRNLKKTWKSKRQIF